MKLISKAPCQDRTQTRSILGDTAADRDAFTATAYRPLAWLGFSSPKSMHAVSDKCTVHAVLGTDPTAGRFCRDTELEAMVPLLEHRPDPTRSAAQTATAWQALPKTSTGGATALHLVGWEASAPVVSPLPCHHN